VSKTLPYLIPCQHASGVSFVATVVDGLMPSHGRVAPVVLDLMGYDGSAAMHTLNKVAAGVGLTHTH
jgi:hypothetical protein